MPSLKKFINAMRWAADSDRVGYSQSDRESLQEWKFYTNENTNTDCSKLVIEALQYAGFNTGWATYTGNMSSALCANGWKRIANNGNPKVGDILLNDRDHVAVYIGNGQLAQASIGEGGRVSGGARGDQTHNEVNIRSYYNYPWNCYLRYTKGMIDMDEKDMDKLADKIAKAIWSLAYEGDAQKKWNSDGTVGGTMFRNNYNVFRMISTSLNNISKKLDKLVK